MRAANEPSLGKSRGNAGKGRAKGSRNKVPAALKDMILAALDQCGGIEYLKSQALSQPVAFMALVGKVLPMQINANVNAKVLPSTVDDFL